MSTIQVNNVKRVDGTQSFVIDSDGSVTFSAGLDVSSGSIKLDGNYPVGTNNVALGDTALDSLTSGASNVGIGTNALTANTSGSANIAVGKTALQANTTASNNVAVGGNSLYCNATGANNTALGGESLFANTATANTGVGYQAGYSNTTGSVDAFGYLAGYSNTTGSGNVYFGNRTGYSATTAIENTGIGYYPLYTNTGSYNSALGYASLYYNSTGQYNTALGTRALQSNTTSSSNTAVGYRALFANTTGLYNNALGVESLDANTTGTANNAMGYRALTAFNGSYNVAIGHGAGQAQTSGDWNTYVGPFAGNDITTGAKNTIIGAYQGNQGGLDIRTSSNYIVLSDGDGNPRQVISSNGSVGFNGRVPGSGGVTLGGLGAEFNNGDGVFYFARSGGTPFFLQRCTNTGEMIAFMSGANTRGSIGLSPTGADNFKVYGCSNYAEFGSCTVGFQTYGGFNHIVPYPPGTCAYRDAALCLGSGSVRWNTIYATNGSINTSDINEKQDIEALTEAELRVAIKAKALVKKFRWKSSVAEKGEDVARIHVGIIAQELQEAFESEGLDPHRYSLFTKDVWWEAEIESQQPVRDENNMETDEMETVSRIEYFQREENAPEGAIKKTRLGVRYQELLAFIIAAI